MTGVPFPVIVRACDADWNTVGSASDVVRLTSTAGNAVLPAPSVLIGGQVTFEVQLPSVGSSRFTAQDQTNLLIPLGSSANVTAVALAGFRFQDIAAHERQAGSAFVTSLTAIDAGGNVVLGYHGPVQLEQLTSQGLGRVSPGVIMLASGVWSGSLTVFRADESNSQIGSVRVHAHLPGDPGRSGTGDEFVVHPGPFARLQLLVPGMVAVPGSEAGYDGAPASQAATAPFTLTVRATDEYWNPVPSVHQVRVVSSDSWATTPLTLTLAGGTAQGTVALATTGGQTLTAYDIDEPAVQSMVIPPIAVTAAAASHFQFSTLPAGITAGQPIAVTIRAVDAGGSIIPTFNGNARLFATTGPGTISPETATFTEGVWTGQLTFFGAGDDVVATCVDYATPPHLGPAAAVDVTPAAWSGLQVLLPGESALPGTEAGVVGDPQRQDAGEPFTVTVRAIDDFFNVVPTVNGALELTGTDPRLGVVPAALADGTAAVTVTPYLAGTQTITASALTAPVSRRRHQRRAGDHRRTVREAAADPSRAVAAARCARRAHRQRRRPVDHLRIPGRRPCDRRLVQPAAGRLRPGEPGLQRPGRRRGRAAGHERGAGDVQRAPGHRRLPPAVGEQPDTAGNGPEQHAGARDLQRAAPGGDHRAVSDPGRRSVHAGSRRTE